MQYIMDPHNQQQPPPPPPSAQTYPQPQPPTPTPLQVFQLPVMAPPQSQAPPASAPAPALPATASAPSPQIQHFGQVANPTPNLVTVPVNNHPPYAQMIAEAITALKDRNGSSKRAIAKYIERVYSNSNLPGTHSALLTHHLKRLKDQGNLVMVKHSYKLPSSRSPPVGPSPTPNSASNGPKRRPGRPPKAKAGVTPPPPPVQSAPVDSAAPITVHIPPAPFPVSVPGPNADPVSVFASLGLVDGPVPVPLAVSSSPVSKRRPGRPKKADVGGAALHPNPTLGKKAAAGRPRKVAAKNAINAAANAAGIAGSVVVSPRPQPKLKADGTPAKPRGRPPKKTVQGPVRPVAVPVAAGGLLAPGVYVGEGALATAPALPGKRRGRPPAKAQNGPKAPRKLSGKPLGRPKKNAQTNANQGPNLQHMMAYNEMRSKLDFFQSRIKQTVGVLKPCLDNSTGAANALGALRELEELANLELGPPATVQGQQPPPQN